MGPPPLDEGCPYLLFAEEAGGKKLKHKSRLNLFGCTRIGERYAPEQRNDPATLARVWGCRIMAPRRIRSVCCFFFLIDFFIFRIILVFVVINVCAIFFLLGFFIDMAVIYVQRA